MLAASFQLLTWCTANAGDFFFIPTNIDQDVKYCSLVLKMSLGQQKWFFLILKPYKTSLKLLRKKWHNLHYLLHNWPLRSHNLPKIWDNLHFSSQLIRRPKRSKQRHRLNQHLLIFYRTCTTAFDPLTSNT